MLPHPRPARKNRRWGKMQMLIVRPCDSIISHENTPVAALHGLLVSAFISMALAVPALRAADGLPAIAKPAVNAPVTVTDTAQPGQWTTALSGHHQPRATAT